LGVVCDGDLFKKTPREGGGLVSWWGGPYSTTDEKNERELKKKKANTSSPRMFGRSKISPTRKKQPGAREDSGKRNCPQSEKSKLTTRRKKLAMDV